MIKPTELRKDVIQIIILFNFKTLLCHENYLQ